jgi:hypothetical protein
VNINDHKTFEASGHLRAAHDYMANHTSLEPYGDQHPEGWSILSALRLCDPDVPVRVRRDAERLALHVATLNDFRHQRETRSHAMSVLLHASLLCPD